MRGPTWLPKRAVWFALLGALAPAVGCTEIFGFERSGDIVVCVHDSDCPNRLLCLSNTCTKDCQIDGDCRILNYPPGTASCVQNVCVARSAPADASGIDGYANGTDATAGDGPSESTGDGPGESAGDGPSESRAPDASLACIPACQTFAYCENASCLDFQAYGYPGAGQSTQQIAADNKLVSIRILPVVCGFVTGIGFVNVNAERGQRIRFGLYTDNSGEPDQLIAQSSPAVLIEGANELPVEPPALIGCADVAPHYWVTGLWDDTDIEFVSELSTDTAAVFAPINLPIEDQIDAGLPTAFPTPPTPFPAPLRIPHVYVIVARMN
jgi:hypothetical protein